ncbi:MAG: phosphate ABC transporter permease PstA [Synechococcales bacterium]|nr:phosphate ABC transporter permease PstA [Synechococcales bacterium]
MHLDQQSSLPPSIEVEKPYTLAEIRASVSRRQLVNQIFVIAGLVAIGIGLVSLLALVASLAISGVPRISWEFLTSFPDADFSKAGILAAWVGSCLVIFVTVLAAVPLGVGAGIYLEEYAKKNWLSDIIEINVTNLAGVPSIVYGLLALGLFKYYLKLGSTVITAGLTLSLLVIPIVIVTTREALRAIPSSLREAAYAVGATKWRMIQDHMLPYSIGSVLTGVIIGLSRAIGETAPLITIGALTFIAFLPPVPFTPDVTTGKTAGLFDWLLSPFTVMPIQMYDWVSRPDEGFHINAAATGVILLVMTLGMNGIAIYLRYRLRRGLKW